MSDDVSASVTVLVASTEDVEGNKTVSYRLVFVLETSHLYVVICKLSQCCGQYCKS